MKKKRGSASGKLNESNGKWDMEREKKGRCHFRFGNIVRCVGHIKHLTIHTVSTLATTNIPQSFIKTVIPKFEIT
jgi:hypothetical protein